MALDEGATGPDDGDSGEREHRESVAGRISMIIGAFDASSPTLSLSQLTERTGLPKSTVHRMADQLVEFRWLERTPTGYRLGIRFFEVGGLVSSRTHLRERSLPFLQDLQSSTRHSVHLGILEGRDVVILEKLWGHDTPSLPTRVGGRMPAHRTAAGKALLAFAPEKAVEQVIAEGLERRTGRTIVVPELFRQELAAVRTAHWALETEENVAGLRCVAAPIRGAGRAIAAVSVSRPVHKLDVSRVVPVVRRCATDIWTQLFGRRAVSEGSYAPPDQGRPWDVEKAAKYGGSTALSGGGIWAPNNPTLLRQGRGDDPEDVRRYLRAVVGDRVPAARLDAFAAAAPWPSSFSKARAPTCASSGAEATATTTPSSRGVAPTGGPSRLSPSTSGASGRWRPISWRAPSGGRAGCGSPPRTSTTWGRRRAPGSARKLSAGPRGGSPATWCAAGGW